MDWLWVKPIRRLEETVKNCLRKKALTFWQTAYAGVCCCAPVSVWALAVWDDWSILYIRYVCMFVLFCLCTSVCMGASKCPLSSGKKMSYGRSDYMLRWCTVFRFFLVFFFSLLKPKASHGHCKNIWRLKSDPELWSDLEPKQREKPCRETKSLVLCDLCGVEFHPIVLNSQKCFKMKRKAVCKIYDTLHRHEASCSMWGWEFPLHHVYHWAPCHWERSLRLYWIWQFKQFQIWNPTFKRQKHAVKRGVPQ